LKNFTTEQLYEQTKLVLRAHHPDMNFILACHRCGDCWPENTEMGMVKTHFDISHPDDADNLMLDLIWIGVGQPPESRI